MTEKIKTVKEVLNQLDNRRKKLTDWNQQQRMALLNIAAQKHHIPPKTLYSRYHRLLPKRG